MSTDARLAISIPQTFPGGKVDPALIHDYVVRAEALGFDSAWVQEQIIGRMPTLEPMELLTFAAAHTRRIRLGCAVFITAVRGPIHFAKSVSTLDHLSGGRLIVGVGLGYPRLAPTYGVALETRVARFVEGIRLMKALWTEESVTFQGQFWQLRDVAMEPKPLQKPHPPIWFGAHHPNALRRAVQLGDGFIGAGSSSTQQFVEEVRILRPLIEQAKRDPETFPLAKRVYIAVDDDKTKAGQRLNEWFRLHYGQLSYDKVSVWGSPDECTERLQEIVQAGAKLLVLTSVFDEAEQLERIASGIAPHFA